MEDRHRAGRPLFLVGAVLLLFFCSVALHLGRKNWAPAAEPVDPQVETSVNDDSSRPSPGALPPPESQFSSLATDEEGLPPGNQDLDREAGSPDSDQRRALSGMTAQEELDFLLKSHDRYIVAMADPATTSEDRSLIELGFVSRCVSTILRAQGRADYGNPDELRARGGFVLRDLPDEWMFAADRALFKFPKGEFPAYDETRTQVERFDLEGVEYPSDPEWLAGREALFSEALSALGATVPDSK